MLSCCTCRFGLLWKTRLAKQFATLAGRRELVKERLLAYSLLLMCSPSSGEAEVQLMLCDTVFEQHSFIEAVLNRECCPCHFMQID
jgi:hypothetical protein